MDINITYPSAIAVMVKRRMAKKLIFLAFEIATAVCVLVNLSKGGTLWSFAVVGAMILFWMTFIYNPVIENTLISKISVSVIATCLYLLLIDWVFSEHLTWSENAVTTIGFSLLLLNGSIFFLGFKRQKRNLFPLLFLILGSFALLITSLAGAVRTTWQVIVMGSLALLIIILSFVTYPKQILNELKKKFHT